MRHTRLGRLIVESGLGDDYPAFVALTSDGGHAGGSSPAEYASALLDAVGAGDSTMMDDDLAYVRAVAAGERDDDEPA